MSLISGKKYVNVYSNIFLMFFLSTGFDITSALKACCGSGGKYRYSSSRVCGRAKLPVCSNPDQFISWDGMHMTQRAYKFLAKWLVADILPQLNCNFNIADS